eukprot:gene3095-biopygen4847
MQTNRIRRRRGARAEQRGDEADGVPAGLQARRPDAVAQPAQEAELLLPRPNTPRRAGRRGVAVVDQLDEELRRELGPGAARGAEQRGQRRRRVRGRVPRRQWLRKDGGCSNVVIGRDHVLLWRNVGDALDCAVGKPGLVQIGAVQNDIVFNTFRHSFNCVFFGATARRAPAELQPAGGRGEEGHPRRRRRGGVERGEGRAAGETRRNACRQSNQLHQDRPRRLAPVSRGGRGREGTGRAGWRPSPGEGEAAEPAADPLTFRRRRGAPKRAGGDERADGRAGGRLGFWITNAGAWRRVRAHPRDDDLARRRPGAGALRAGAERRGVQSEEAGE